MDFVNHHLDIFTISRKMSLQPEQTRAMFAVFNVQCLNVVPSFILCVQYCTDGKNNMLSLILMRKDATN